ncbi:hypothetical protein CI105_05975 [Candidatus Izimaplasma bacterium ZiA1]|uniref:GNAT family N-acetyltransferase n=1 Tax=Candidatus Izimoplasma sp. ZiA1 TaxID=2024899 RepID=UPI000BAA8FA3|nr:hypothetical protein CI105_05975 [Candidatus Izimaplasma bacterium ZiA1]
MDVRIATTKKEVIDNIMVRGLVFIKGQNIDWEIEMDFLDNDSVLFTAYKDLKPVGAARLYNNKVGRVAVLSEYRKQGIGRIIMDKIHEYAKVQNIKTLKLHAQLHVKDFYENLGYVTKGEIFKEADIDHILMEKEV